jgi:TRAP-type C4-dicarboxylate transport system permease small subunit
MKFFRLIDLMIEKITTWALVSGVFLMLALALTTIILRWFNMSLLWLDPFVRHLVFIVTFLGGIIATGRGSHIGIDILSKSLEVNNSTQAILYLKRFVSIVSVLSLSWLTHASWKFMQVELEFGRDVFLGIHSGFLVGIIPVGFALIAYRFFFVFLNSFAKTENEAC